MSEWVSEWMNEYKGWVMIKLIRKKMNEWVSEWMTEWMKTNKLESVVNDFSEVNGWLSDSVSERVRK